MAYSHVQGSRPRLDDVLADDEFMYVPLVRSERILEIPEQSIWRVKAVLQVIERL